MNFYNHLLEQTATARQGLLATPIIQGALRGEVSLPSYVSFLREAFHHVRHTVPLLQAMKAALPPQHAWLHGALDEYIEEEAGHDEWILDDIRACGSDAEAVRHGAPGHATEVMVAAVATDEPQIDPKAAEANTAAMAKPPRKRPITMLAMLNKALEIPPCVAKFPINMNSGITDKS